MQSHQDRHHQSSSAPGSSPVAYQPEPRRTHNGPSPVQNFRQRRSYPGQNPQQPPTQQQSQPQQISQQPVSQQQAPQYRPQGQPGYGAPQHAGQARQNRPPQQGGVQGRSATLQPQTDAPLRAAPPQGQTSLRQRLRKTSSTDTIAATPSTTKKTPAQNAVKTVNIRRLVFAAAAFFMLFTTLAATKFFNDNKTHSHETQAVFSSSLNDMANYASQKIDAEIANIDGALFSAQSPQQMTDTVVRSEAVQGAILLNAQKTILARSGPLGDIIAKLDTSNLPKGDVQINSLISDEGRAYPLIIRRRNQAYLIAALGPNSLLSGNSANAALIMDGGRIIDSGANIQSPDALTVYGLTPQDLVRLTKNEGASAASIEPFEQAENKLWLGAARVPKSFLSVINITDRQIAPSLKENLILFGLLLLGMTWLIWMLFSEMMKQVKSLKHRQHHDEISRQRYEAAVDGSHGGIWEIDLAKNRAYLSPSLAKTFNLSEEHTHLPMSQFLGLFAENDREKLFAAIRRSHISGEFDVELGVAHLPIYMACRGRPSVRGSDNAKVIIGMAINITEMRGAQARLQAAEARLFDALKSMTDSFVIWDQMDRLVLWNSRFESFFGFQPEQLQVGLDRATVDYHAKQSIASITERAEGNEIALNDGRWIRYSETRTADGGCVSIGTEVTAIRSRENELQVNQDALEKTISVLRESQVRIVELAENYEQEKIRAEEASQSKSEFLANMSHELRTPLNAINGFSDIMKKELFGPLGDPRYKEYVSDILFSGQHLLSLINDILDMSKIEAGKMTLNTEMLQINDMIAQVIRIVRGRADDNRLKLIFDEIETPEIEADPRAVKQVLLNLMTNAIKFTPEGGSVTVRVEPKSAGLIIRVTDTGIGISKEDIDRLAQPFEQIDSQHSRKHEGTGLGLALSKSLVELHGGNFTMESEVGQGTTVIFTLPSSPPKVVEEKPDTEVGSEISRLAKDIADVLVEGEARVDHNRSNQAQPPQMTQPQAGQPQAGPPPVQAPSAPTEYMPHAAPPQVAPQQSNPNMPQPYKNSAA